MAISIKQGKLVVPNAQDKLRQKGTEQPVFATDYTLLDIETTGLSPYRDRITELGAIKVRNNKVVAQYSNLVKYAGDNSVPAFITKLNGITERQLLEHGIESQIAIKEFRDFISDDLILGYNINFDLNFLYDLSQKNHLATLNNDYLDVLKFARAYYPDEQHNRLVDCIQRIGLRDFETHHGLQDSLDTKQVYDYFKEHFSPENLEAVKRQIKDFSLTDHRLSQAELGFYNPISRKMIMFAGNLHLDLADAQLMVENLGGQVVSSVDNLPNYVVIGDHDRFHGQLAEVQQVQKLKQQGQRISLLTESFFLNMLDDWARG